MKKKTSVIPVMLSAALLGSMVCHASIVPSQGPGQIGYSSVVLCNSLTLHSSASFGSSSLQTLKYGDRIIVMSQEGEWAHVVLGDSEDSLQGWVDSDFIAVDPAWYQTEDDTAVYAWDDTSAPKVALLDRGTSLPILRDDGNWILVSLRGAAGWINNPVRSTPQNSSAGSQASSQSSSGSSYSSGSSDSSGSSQDYIEPSNESQGSYITIYARDGSTVSVFSVGGAMYEDSQGRTYIKQDNDGYYYCITTDVTYAFDPGVWTGEAYGENEFPNEVDDYTGADYGENDDY
jgi:uncharacterized protein YgiM (DUF1202 family)